MSNHDAPETIPLPVQLQIIASIISEGEAADLGDEAVRALLDLVG